jgi:hypothetical protein
MKKLVSMLVAGGLVLGLGTPAFAQNAPGASSAPVSAQLGGGSVPSDMMGSCPSAKALVWTGATVFIAGMGVGIYGFLNNKNGAFPEFGEATATDNHLGAAGLTAAFAAAALMAVGHRISRHSPHIQGGVGRFAVTKRLTW